MSNLCCRLPRSNEWFHSVVHDFFGSNKVSGRIGRCSIIAAAIHHPANILLLALFEQRLKPQRLFLVSLTC